MMMKVLSKTKAFASEFVNSMRFGGKPKIFCIGHNKTGTTSIQKALIDFGYVVGNQAKAERLIHAYKTRNFEPIIRYCRTAEAFQDIPFSLPYLYVVLDQCFPKSKFILTVRQSADQWYESLIRFQAKRFGKGILPNADVLRDDSYRYRGFSYDVKKIVYDTDDDNLYDRSKLIEFYNAHNGAVIDYFRFRPNDLLVLDLSTKGAYQNFCRFIGKEPLYDDFPWLNKT